MFRLFYALRYFRLRHNEKLALDILPTLVLAIILTLPFLFIPGTLFFRPNGLLDKILTLTSCLTGFYVAALVAAATYSHKDLDKVIRSGPIALVTKDDDGKRISEYLTRRQFACYIFGYLSFSSLTISFVAGFFISLSGADFHTLANKSGGFIAAAYPWFRGVTIFGTCLLVCHLFVATSLGLYYLMDRLYRYDMEITSKKTDLAL